MDQLAFGRKSNFELFEIANFANITFALIQFVIPNIEIKPPIYLPITSRKPFSHDIYSEYKGQGKYE